MSSKYFISEKRNNVNHLNYYYFTSSFTENELQEIKKIWDGIPKSKAEVGGGDTSNVTDYRISDISWIGDNDESEWLYSKIAVYAKQANNEMWDFDIKYVADFKVFKKDKDNIMETWIVDVKGMKTSIYKMKIKLLLSKYPEINFIEAYLKGSKWEEKII